MIGAGVALCPVFFDPVSYGEQHVVFVSFKYKQIDSPMSEPEVQDARGLVLSVKRPVWLA
jgi:hypothetical protein